jgi:hypothetical protein
MRTALNNSLRNSVAKVAKVLGLSESDFVRRAVQQQLWDETFEATLEG